jgi:drug/metabolite transporter (DMT)-like permease
VLVVSEAIAIAPLGIILIVAGHVHFSWTFVWVIVLAGALQAIYFMLLRAGYARGDLSLVYPISRGTGALFATIAGIVLIGERPGLVSLAGAAVIVVAVLVLTNPQRGPKSLQRGAILLALAAGLAIAVYSWWDRRAVVDLAIPIVFYSWAAAVTEAAWLTPAMLTDRQRLRSALRHWPSATIAGVMRFAAYAFILLAYSWQGAPLSLVAPLRETGILVAVWLGGSMLGEEDRKRRLIASVGIVAGGLLLVAG